MTNLYSILKSGDITLPTHVHIIKAIVFPVVMYRCESWTIKKAEHWRIDAFELWWPRTLENPLDCSTPGFLCLHYHPEFAQTHVHWVGDAIQPSQPLLSPSAALSFPASGSFPMNLLFKSGGQSIRASASASVLSMNIQSWFPLGLTGLIFLLSKALSRGSPVPQLNSINPLALGLLYGPTFTSVHDYWKNHSFDYIDLCWQSDISAF